MFENNAISNDTSARVIVLTIGCRCDRRPGCKPSFERQVRGTSVLGALCCSAKVCQCYKCEVPEFCFDAALVSGDAGASHPNSDVGRPLPGTDSSRYDLVVGGEG